MGLKKNDETRAVICAMSSDGNGIARVDGMTVFVPKTAVGDEARIRIIKVCKNYCIGKMTGLEKGAPSRVDPDCPVFEKCGGCTFRHISYDREAEIKYERVKECIRRIAKIDIIPDEIISAQNTDGYRNKAQLPIGVTDDGRIFAGFYAKKSHRIIECETCKLQPPEFEIITKIFTDHLQKNGITVYDEQTGKGLCRHIYLRKGFESGQIAVCLIINGENLKKSDELVKNLVEKVPDIVSITVNINRNKNNVIMGEKCRTLYGLDFITDRLCGVKFALSPMSFYQVNSKQAERLFQKAVEFADPNEQSTVVDLYCGAGAIGLITAKNRKIGRLFGVEKVKEAVENARENARINGIENAEFICGDAAAGADILSRRRIKPDVVFLDPPRKGCDRKVLEIAANRMNPKKIVYVSCDPATFARDAALLKEMNFTLKRAVAVDLFPRTPHVETVGLFENEKKQ